MKYQSFEHFMVEVVCDVERRRRLPWGISDIVVFLIQQGWDFFDEFHYSPIYLAIAHFRLYGLGFAGSKVSSYIQNAWFPMAVQDLGNHFKTKYESNKNDDDYISQLYNIVMSRLDNECSSHHCFSKC